MITSFWLFEEYFASKIFYGLTLHPGIALYNIGIFLFFSKYIGMIGLSFIIIAINYWLYYLLKNKKYKTFLIISLLIFLLPNISFFSQKDVEEINQNKIKISIIQGNISTNEYKFAQSNNELSYEIFKKYINLSLKSIKEYSPHIIIWPETSVHRWMMRLPDYRNEILDFARNNNINLIIGTPDLTPENKEYNSIFIISKNGKIIGKYYKNKLVPYYEKVFENGKKIKVINLEGIKTGFEICFEAMFPQVTTKLKRQNAELIIIASNNGMFGYSIVPYLMSEHGIFRAVENNIYIIQATNSGISQIISPDGKILKSSKLYERKIINYEIPIKKLNKTFYSVYGENMYYIIFIITIIILIKNSALFVVKNKK
ncbi:apolipoprotein N-acyltransferase [Marinitoga aeolica]|uniref:Apolipoprotein N-acyltransferase n=1 Tax=Marinitoga aeolica TaxID=2809031 RepID=A0ABY8PSR6_9BACT|nr:apolipoprotein N-acyltransferase [Marinitoga aeolica]WGS65676.1 apolipoprotein N-acyltransferase [Marinitoga aeolica]